MIALRQSLILVLAVAAVFGLSLKASFHFDDYAILSDPVLTSSSGWWEVWRPEQTRPLTYFTFWLNYRLGGRNPIGYHAVNLALHLAAVLLLWDTLGRIIPARPAFIAATLFAIHPIQAEAVDYVFARGTLLMAVFCLLSLRSWMRGRRWVSVAYFAAALLAKEECAAFPVFLFLLQISVSRRVQPLRQVGTMLGLSLAAGTRVLLATTQPGSGAGLHAGISPLGYFASQGPVILRYFRLLVLPWGFTADPDILVPAVWVAALAWSVIVGAAYFASRRFSQAKAGFWWLGGLVLLAPSSSILPAADLAADRRFYLPMIAFAAAAGLLVGHLRLRVLAPAGALLAFIGLTRTDVWLTERSLWQEAVEHSPAKVRPRIQLARALEPAKALPSLLEARRLAPEDERVASELGKTYLLLGRPAEALAEFGRALALAPGDPHALNNRGVALLALGQGDAARQDFERALKLDACLFDARFNLLRLGVKQTGFSACRFSDEQKLLGSP